MNDLYIVTVFTIIDDVMVASGHKSDVRAGATDAEVLTVAVVAAKYFQNHHERALWVMVRLGYLSGKLSSSRFNRRLHRLEGWLEHVVLLIGQLSKKGEVYVIDSMPVPVCGRARASRCKKVRGRAYCGYCAAKGEKFFGWRLHLLCTPEGVPVHFQVLPASLHDLTPIHELTFDLPEGARVFGDKGYNALADEVSILTETGVRLIPIRRSNMTPHHWTDEWGLRDYRHTIEIANSQLEKMGVERLHARSNRGLDLKLHASLLALAFTNFN